MPELILLVIFLVIYVVPFALLIVVVSAIRKTPMRNGFIALGWSFLILLMAAIVGSLVSEQYAGVVFWLAGAVLTYLLASRGNYKLDWQSWVLLVLFAPGYWLLLWRRANRIWKEQRVRLPEGAT